ncbi:MAG: LD-carboxypeptidase [Vicinamibacterales bacterium]
MTPRTRAGLRKYRPAGPGSRVALVAPASGFRRDDFDRGVAELRRLGFDPVWDESVFDRLPMTAGTPEVRARAFMRAMLEMDADLVMAVRGGYGSIEILPHLDLMRLRDARTAFCGYSDVTSLHAALGSRGGLATLHGPMIEGRVSEGPSGYDSASFLRALSTNAPGETGTDGLEVLRSGEATGPLVGGTLTQLLSSFETPFVFDPPDGHVLFLDEVAERPYRLHRMLTQWRLSGRFVRARAVVFGQLPRCDEPGGTLSALDAIRDALAGFPGPILAGLPSGHTTSRLVSLPLGAEVRVEASASPRLVCEEAAAG